MVPFPENISIDLPSFQLIVAAVLLLQALAFCLLALLDVVTIRRDASIGPASARPKN